MTYFHTRSTSSDDAPTITSDGTDIASPRHLPGALSGLRHQLRFDLLTQFRSPTSVFFTAVLPVAFLVMFTGLGGGDASDGAQRWVPATMIVGLLSGTITNLAITLVYLREYGMLRHVLVTPLPRSSYLGSRILASAILSMLATTIIGTVGALVYGTLPTQPALVLAALVAGTVSGSAIGIAVAALVRSELAATPIANAITLPLLVVSGAFFPLDAAPGWLQQVAAWTPTEPVVRLAIDGYAGAADPGDLPRLLIVTLIWTVGSILLARRCFTWTPRSRR